MKTGMKIKTFRASTMQGAFQAIKAELGPDAVILSTTHLRAERSLTNPFGQAQVEVAVALDRDASPEAGPSIERTEPRAASVAASVNHLADGFEELVAASIARQGRDAYRAGESPGRRSCLQDAESMPRSPSNGTEPAEERIQEIVVRLTTELTQRGCGPSLASAVAWEAASSIEPAGAVTEARARVALRQAVMARVTPGGPLLAGEARHKTVLVVGPTGSGKTSVVAKLAEQYRLKEGRSVTVITVKRDHDVMVEPLHVRAAAIGVGCQYVRSQREMAECLWRHQDDTLALIDAPGRSLLDRDASGELRELITGQSAIETHLVLPAATPEEDLAEILSCYTKFSLDRIIFTKLDETMKHGRMLGALAHTRLPLSYVSTGQQTAESLEVATPERVADLICGKPLRISDRMEARRSECTVESDTVRRGARLKDDMAHVFESLYEGVSQWIGR